MARLHQLIRRTAVVCIAIAACVALPAPARAEQLRVKAQLPPLPVDVPVVLPSEVAVTPPAPLPEVRLGLPPTGAAPTTATPAPPLPPAAPAAAPTPPAAAPVAAPPALPAPAPPATTVGGLVPTSRTGPEQPRPWQGVIAVLRSFAVPLGLIAALVAFLAVQAFVDRRDPKLAVAPMDEEVLSFT